MQNRLPKNPFFMPNGEVCDQMCDRCPFKPDGSGHAIHHEDFPNIVEHVAMGLRFYCHDTVIMSDETTFDAEKNPDPPFQDHFKLCKGAVLYKQGELELPDGVDGTRD